MIIVKTSMARIGHNKCDVQLIKNGFILPKFDLDSEFVINKEYLTAIELCNLLSKKFNHENIYICEDGVDNKVTYSKDNILNKNELFNKSVSDEIRFATIIAKNEDYIFVYRYFNIEVFSFLE